MRRYLSGPFVIAAILVASVLPVIYAALPAVASRPYQFGAVDIFTNKGGQGPNQYGGSFTIGEGISLYVYSSFDGVATITVTLPDGEVFPLTDPFTISAGQTGYLENVVGPPAGQHRFDLQVCGAGPPPPETTTTFLMAAVPPGSQEIFHSSPVKNKEKPLSDCQYDSTWIDAVGGGPADIVVPQCWVSPANPHQEDSVTFHANVANAGGSDAPNVKIDAYLDGGFWSSERDTFAAGQSYEWYSDRSWIAEDGSHTLRVVANADHSVQESDYGNNEASCTFFVSPRTVTATLTFTKTSTRTQTQRTTTTIVIMTTTTKVETARTTIQKTVTVNPVTSTRTLTGLVTSTAYSPTVTVTVTVVSQVVSNPVLWVTLAAFVAFGAVLQRSNSDRLRRLLGRVASLFSLVRFFGWVTRPCVRRALFAVSLIGVVVLAFSLQAGQMAFASRVTTTRTVTVTEWTTFTESLTLTKSVTSTLTKTSSSTMTNTRYTTTTPTTTATIDRRSTTTTYMPTTTTTTSTQAKGPSVEVSLDYNTQSTFFYVPNVDQSIPLPAKTLGFILNEVNVKVTATNVGNEPARKVWLLLHVRSPGNEPTSGSETWQGDLDPGQKAAFSYSFKVRRCVPPEISVDGGYQDTNGQSRQIEKREAPVPVGDFIIIDAKGGWTEVTLNPKIVEFSRTISGAGITLLRILFWSMVAEKVAQPSDAFDLEENIKARLIDKPLDEAWDALKVAIGGIDVSFEVGLGWETYNLYSCARKGHAPSGNGVVFYDGTMEYWPLWWSAPGIAATLIKSAVGIG